MEWFEENPEWGGRKFDAFGKATFASV